MWKGILQEPCLSLASSPSDLRQPCKLSPSPSYLTASASLTVQGKQSLLVSDYCAAGVAYLCLLPVSEGWVDWWLAGLLIMWPKVFLYVVEVFIYKKLCLKICFNNCEVKTFPSLIFNMSNDENLLHSQTIDTVPNEQNRKENCEREKVFSLKWRWWSVCFRTAPSL